LNEKHLELLFEPLEMPNLKLKNRFYMAPMGTSYDMDRLKYFLVARAKGETALITTGEISVHKSGRGGIPYEPLLETDNDIMTLVPLVKTVQQAGAKIVAQINHMGRYCHSRLIGQQSVAPSPVPSRYTGETPRELSTGEVDDLVTAFAEAGLRAQKAGFDGIELCGSSGYLISQFLSPLTNRREDKYGGSILNRAYFLLAILQETRKRVGTNFNICVKFDADDGMKGGKTLDDSLIMAPEMVKAGADRLHVWAGWHESNRPMLPMFVQRGAFSYLASEIKKTVDVPVSTVGRINDPYVAADILARGEADLLGLGRALLCDPDFVKKAMEGRSNEIRRCIACCHCFDQMMRHLLVNPKIELECALNAELGHEGEKLIKQVEDPKNVAVVGSGPAGMEAARIAALKGHKVTIYEKDNFPGGLINLAFLPPHKEELKNIVEYYSAQMDILGVDVRYNEEFNVKKLKETGPDVLLIATGATELMPAIPGLDYRHVVTSLEVFRGKTITENNIVVVGAGLIGLETAEFLADQGKKVTVIEMQSSAAPDVGMTTRWGMLSRISQKVTILTSTRVVEIKKDKVIVINPENTEKEISGEMVVLAAGLKSDKEMQNALDKAGIEYVEIGSCRAPGQIKEAIADGFAAGCRI